MAFVTSRMKKKDLKKEAWFKFLTFELVSNSQLRRELDHWRENVRPKLCRRWDMGRCKTQLYDYCIPSCEAYERCENRPGLAGWIIKIKHWLRKLFSGDPLTY